jgi:hypothetical protein
MSCYASSIGISCGDGWHWSGLLCELNVPSGFTGITALDIAKGSYTRPAGILPGCGVSQNSDSLCYPYCTSPYSGVGPVCWGICPNGYIACGGGCAIDDSTCLTVTADQALSIVVLATSFINPGEFFPKCAFLSAYLA